MRLEERMNGFESTLGALLAIDELETEEQLTEYIKLQLRLQKENDKENSNLELFLYFDKYCRNIDLEDVNIKLDFVNCNAGIFIDELLERIIISFLFKQFSIKLKQIKNEL